MVSVEAIALVEQFLERGRLTKVQEIVFRCSWEGKTYLNMAEDLTYDPGHIEVCDHFAGNPLALKIAASAVQEVYAGDLRELMPFLRQGKLHFEDINDLLEQQFNRLSPLEQQVMYWLAVN